MSSKTEMKERNIQVRDFVFDEAGYLQASLTTGNEQLSGTFRVYDPQNGMSMKFVGIEDDPLEQEVAMKVVAEWKEIENDLRNISIMRYQELVSGLTAEERLTEAMHLAGYEPIPQRAEHGFLGFRKMETGEELNFFNLRSVYNYLDTQAPTEPEDWRADMINRLVHPDSHINYFIQTDGKMEFYESLEAAVTAYTSMAKTGRSLGISVSDTDNINELMFFDKRTHCILSRFTETGYFMEDAPEDFLNSHPEKEEELLNIRQRLFPVLGRAEACEMVYQTLTALKTKALTEPGNEYRCVIANSRNPKDYVQINVRDFREAVFPFFNEPGIHMEIFVMKNRDIVTLSTAPFFAADIMEKDSMPDFDWHKEFEEDFEIRGMLDKLDTDFTAQFVIYSDDLTENVRPLKEYYELLQPKPDVLSYEEIMQAFTEMTESDKEALVQGVEAAMDYNEPVPQMDRELYQYIKAEEMGLVPNFDLPERGKEREPETEKAEQKDMAQPHLFLVGQIEYLDIVGKPVERIAYTDAEEFIKDVEEADYYGGPVSITVYKDSEGNSVAEQLGELESIKGRIQVVDEPQQLHGNFNDLQMDEIRRGFITGLTEEQVSLYATSEFNNDQMREIRIGLETGLSNEQVSLYAKPYFSGFQMSVIRIGLEDGLSVEGVSLYAKPEFTWDKTNEMQEIRIGLENGLSVEEVSLYATPKFTWEQMSEIRTGLEHGLSVEQIKQYARPDFNDLQMDEIRLGLEHGLAKEQVSLYAKEEFNDYQMYEIRIGLETGLSIEEVSLYAKPDFNWNQMSEIRTGLKNGLAKEQISLYAKPEFDCRKMDEFRSDLISGQKQEQQQNFFQKMVGKVR